MPISVINIVPSVTAKNPAQEIPSNKYESVTKPFLICLKITGIHHLRWDEHQSKRIWRNLATIYQGCVCFLLFLNFVYSMGQFIDIQGFNEVLLNNIISSVWFLQVFLFSVNNFLCCKRWEKFYEAWDAYSENYKVDTKLTVRRATMIATASYVGWLMATTAFLAFISSADAPPSGFMLYIPQSVAVLCQAVITVAYYFFVSMWYLLTAQFTLTCFFIYRLLSEQYQGIKRCLEKGECINEHIEKLRKQHDCICNMISLADDIISVFIIVAVFTTIPLIVLTLYFVIFVTFEGAAISYIATWWSISLSTIQLAVVFLVGGAVNYMAHMPTDLLYSLDLSNAAQINVLQLNVFLNRLTSQSIGVTAFGLFALDKPTIIAFIGTIATYAIVMIQFKPSG